MILLPQKPRAETEEGRYHLFPNKVLQISKDHSDKQNCHDAECERCNFPVQKVQRCTTPDWTEPKIIFQSSHSLPQGYVTSCPVNLDAFEIPKESYYKCSHKYPVLQSTEPPCRKWEWKKGLAACGDTVIFHKLSPCSSKNLNHHIFFTLASCPSFLPKTSTARSEELSPWHKGVTRLGAKEDWDRPVMGSSSVTFSCHEVTPEKDLLPGSERLQSGKGRGGPICASNDPT